MYGFEAYNTMGTAQIDGTFGVFHVSANGISANLTFGGDKTKVAAVRPSGVASGQRLGILNGVGFSSANYEWINLDFNSAVGSDTFGLRVFNGGNEAVFDSSKKYFCIDGVYTTNLSGTGSAGVIFSPASFYIPPPPIGRRFFILPSGIIAIFGRAPQYAERYCMGVKFDSETSLSLFSTIYSTQGLGGIANILYGGPAKIYSGYIDL